MTVLDKVKMRPCVVALLLCLVVDTGMGQSCSVYESGNTARQMASNPIGSRQNLYIGLVLPVHRPDSVSGETCGSISYGDVLKVEAFFWALRTFGTRWVEYGDVSQHGIVFDSCNSGDWLFQQLKMIEDGQPPTVAEAVNVVAYLIDDKQSVNARTAKLLNPRNSTLVGVSLNDPGVNVAGSKQTFHLSPTASQEASTLLKLIQKSGWGYVQVLYTADDYGEAVFSQFQSNSNDFGISIARSLKFNENDEIPEIDAYPVIVVVIAYSEQKLKVVRALGNKDVIIITTDIGDGVNTLIGANFNSQLVELRSTFPNIYQLNAEQFVSSAQKFTSAGINDRENPWYERFWEDLHKCYIRDSSRNMYSTKCNASLTLGNSVRVNRESVSSIIQGTDIILKALSLTCPNSPCAIDTLNNRRLAFNGHFNTIGYETDRVFNASTNGPVSRDYKIYLYRWSDSSSFQQEVGSVKGDEVFGEFLRSLDLNRETMDSRARIVLKQTRVESDGNRFTLWGYVWVVVIAVLAGLGIILVLIITCLLIFLMTRGLMSGYLWLYAILLFGAFLGYLTLFAYIPIPTAATCGIIRFGVGISYGICFAVMVVLGLLLCKKTEMFSSTRVSTIFIAVSLVLLIAIELVILIIWLIRTPPDITFVLYPLYNRPMPMCNHFTAGVGYTILRTVFENHLLHLIYIMFLILLVLVLAIIIFSRRKYLNTSPYKTQIYAMLAAGIGTGIGTVAIWLVWTLVGAFVGVTQNDVQNYGDAAIAFGLWFTLTWLLIFLLVQIIFEWRKTSKTKWQKREFKKDIVVMANNNENLNKQYVYEEERKTDLTTVDGTIAKQDFDSVNKAPLIMQPNSGNSYNSYMMESKTESTFHHLPQTVPEHAELEKKHIHVFKQGNNFCAECGFAHNPTALHLVHPRSEHSSHNTSIEYNNTTRTHEVMQEPKIATSLQALHLVHPRSRPVSRAGSLDLGQKRMHVSNTRVARSEIGSTHHVHHYAPNIIDLRLPRHRDRTHAYPSHYNNNVYFMEHGGKNSSVI